MLFADITAEQVMAFLTPLAVIIAALLNQWNVNRNAKATKEVKKDLLTNQQRVDEHQQRAEVTLEKIKDTGDSVHILVNNAMSLALQNNAILARRIATMTQDPRDIQAAVAAEEAAKRATPPSSIKKS